MKRFTFDANDHHFEFVCTSRNTRNGFAHDAVCFIDGGDWDNLTSTCNYLNRTWERYAYQSVMQKLVFAQCAKHVSWELDDFKRARNYERMTAKRKAEFIEYLDRECDNPTLRTWCKLYELIENDGIMTPPYPDWYGHRPRTFSPSYFA